MSEINGQRIYFFQRPLQSDPPFLPPRLPPLLGLLLRDEGIVAVQHAAMRAEPAALLLYIAPAGACAVGTEKIAGFAGEFHRMGQRNYLAAHALEGQALELAGLLAAVGAEPPLASAVAILNALSRALAVALGTEADVMPDELPVPVWVWL